MGWAGGQAQHEATSVSNSHNFLVFIYYWKQRCSNNNISFISSILLQLTLYDGQL